MRKNKSHISGINESFSIGAVAVPNRLVQAPMAGVSSRALRLQARRFGAGLVVTEMVSSYGIIYRNRRTLELTRIAAGEHPVAVQLFGNRPEVMAEAARVAVAAGADIIDINMGCPARKVVKTGAGVALMADEDQAARVAAAVVDAAGVPVSAKIRAGPDRKVTAFSLAGRLEAAGIAALCLHPRLGSQGKKGKADHMITAELAARLRIPLIASGDVTTAADAGHLLSEAGCAAVMVGRAALGNPWLYAGLLAGDGAVRMPLAAVISEMRVFYHDLVGELGEERAARRMRKFYSWYLKPFRPGVALMSELRLTSGFAEAERLLIESGVLAAGRQGGKTLPGVIPQAIKSRNT